MNVTLAELTLALLAIGPYEWDADHIADALLAQFDITHKEIPK